MAHQQETTRFIENFIIIWVDSNLHRRNRWSDDIQNSVTALQQIINSIKLFDTCERCIDFIHNRIKEEKIFLIVSGSLGEHLVPQIEHDIKLDSIYVFYRNKLKHEQWARKEQYHKIMGIFTNIQDICDQVKGDIKHGEYELTSIQTLGSQTSKIVNHLDASFMYSQLLQEILLSIEHDKTSLEQAKEDFVHFCRIHYAQNSVELCIIEEFKENYSHPSPIWWYTRECFTYSMLNRALCSQDVEILMKMSFFIGDLHRQLEYLHKTMDNRQILTVYRGQGMVHSAFHRMKQNQGGLISFNNFLSTSTSKEVSLAFARKALKKPEKVAILFEMNIDPSISSVPFASLDKFSYFQANEQEILFSMQTVFRIGEIRLLDDDNQPRFWHVHLTSTNADDEQLRQLTEHMRMELSFLLASEVETNMDPTWRLSKLLVTMGEFDKALITYEIMLDKAVRENNMNLVQAIYYQMAELCMIYKNDWNQARAHLRKMFEVRIYDSDCVVDEAKNDMINIFSSIRHVLISEQTDEDEFHSIMAGLLNKLINLYRDHSAKPLDSVGYQLLVDRYNYIGWVRKRQGKLSEAWANHEQALRILHEHLPPTHPRLALTYNHTASLHLMVNNHLSALDCLEKALHIQEKALKPNHPHLAETHFQLSIVFEHLNKIDEAFQHAKKAIDIGRQAFLTPNDPNIKQYQEQFDKILLLSQSCNELVL